MSPFSDSGKRPSSVPRNNEGGTVKKRSQVSRSAAIGSAPRTTTGSAIYAAVRLDGGAGRRSVDSPRDTPTIRSPATVISTGRSRSLAREGGAWPRGGRSISVSDDEKRDRLVGSRVREEIGLKRVSALHGRSVYRHDDVASAGWAVPSDWASAIPDAPPRALTPAIVCSTSRLVVAVGFDGDIAQRAPRREPRLFY